MSKMSIKKRKIFIGSIKAVYKSDLLVTPPLCTQTHYHTIKHNLVTRLIQKLVIYLSFLAFQHVCALFCELFCETANQSLYTSHNITDFVHPWFCEKPYEKLSLSPLWCFVKIPTVWWKWQNVRWEKWLARWFTKCHL